jgi:hypothetical protein
MLKKKQINIMFQKKLERMFKKFFGPTESPLGNTGQPQQDHKILFLHFYSVDEVVVNNLELI